MNKKKSWKWRCCLLMFCFLFMGCEQEDRSEVCSKEGERIHISLKDMEDKISKKESFIIVFTQEGCRYCEAFYQLFEEYKKQHPLCIFEINLTAEDTSPKENLSKIHKYFPSFSRTPGIYYVKKGKLESSLTDTIQELDLETFDTWINACGLSD